MKKVIKRREVQTSSLEGFKDIDPVIATILSSRGCNNVSELDYQLKHILPPTLKGIDAACALLITALQNNERILIVGDFDVDGATSTTLTVKCLRQMGAKQVDFIVPNRFEYGYGLTPEIVNFCRDKNPDLIITVDNGISSIEGVQTAKELGIKVLVTDHHLPGRELPNADAIVNPNQPGCSFFAKSSAGVGVAFYVMLALRSALRDIGWFTPTNPEPNISEHLDLLALGTVADVVPLEYNNRIFVDQGIKRMRAGLLCEGIKALLIVGGKNIAKIQASDLGFAVGPRLNAAGRLDDMTIGIRCLLSESPEEAMSLAKELDTLNVERRSIEAGMHEEANAILDKLNKELEGQTPSAFCLHREDWHQGVIGILASRIKDKMNRPVIVFADGDGGTIKGSGRSIPGIHLRDVLDDVATHNEGLLSKFGGHAMAAGLSLDKDKLSEFTKAFEKAVDAQIGELGIQAFIESEGELDPFYFNIPFAEELYSYGPWGQAFPEPQFDGRFRLVDQRLICDKHLKLILSPIRQPDMSIEAIAFNVDVTEWPNKKCKEATVVYKLSINEFRGERNLQLMVEYLEAVI